MTDSRRTARDRRLQALVLLLIMVVVLGSAILWLPGSRGLEAPTQALPESLPSASEDPARHAAVARAEEVRMRFDQAVAMLHSRQFEHAFTALHRLLELKPEMPEAHVNMGYALLGLQQYQAAYDFFETATVLRPLMANAWYGIAVALEGLGQLEPAIAAMETYLHLDKGGQERFHARARAAVWEWKKSLGRNMEDSIPVSGSERLDMNTTPISTVKQDSSEARGLIAEPKKTDE